MPFASSRLFNAVVLLNVDVFCCHVLACVCVCFASNSAAAAAADVVVVVVVVVVPGKPPTQ